MTISIAGAKEAAFVLEGGGRAKNVLNLSIEFHNDSNDSLY